MREMCPRLIEHLHVQPLTPDGETAVARFTAIVIQDGSSPGGDSPRVRPAASRAWLAGRVTEGV